MGTTATDLFERYHVSVFRYFQRATGSRDLAEDLTQELFVRVVRGLGTYRPVFETGWLFRIARNLLLDYQRDNPVEHVPLAAAGVLSERATQVVAFGLSEALALLSQGERDAFVLKELAGLSYAEIAAACDTNVETVRERLRNGRARLRKLHGPRMAADENKRRNEEA